MELGNLQNLKRQNFAGYIGVFDSGVGGISVLQEIHRILPHENILFFGDSKNAPYGEKKEEEVRARAIEIVDTFVEAGIKAVVIACNTATSAAAKEIRERYPNMPIIGVEPAIKPAALKHPGGRVLVMATPMTLRLEKYQSLSKRFEQETEVVSLACHGLAKEIEKGDVNGQPLRNLLEQLLHPYKGYVDAVVLGCTHYPFVKEQIRSVLGDIEFYDGGLGTAMELNRELEAYGLLSPSEKDGEIRFFSSIDTQEEIDLYRRFFGKGLTNGL